MLSHGVAVASVNYRYSTIAPLPAPVADAARAVQYLRSRATEWNLNSDRVAAFGTSAGGCTTLWLAYHPDLADPRSPDPVLRESTRLCAAEGWMAQTSIDARVIAGWVGDQVLNHPMIWKGVGAADRADVAAHYERWASLYREFSPYTHVARGAPPVLVAYGLAPAPGATPGLAIHNLQFGVKLKEKADAAGATCYVFNKDMPDPALPRPYDFLLAHLTAP
jgi:acetyl esterase/lipase